MTPRRLASRRSGWASAWWAAPAFGALGVLLLIAGARWAMPASLGDPVGEGGWTDRSPAWFEAEGFFEPELDVDRGQPFSWTHDRGELVAPRLDRSQAYRLTWRLAAGRPPGAPPPPEMRVAVDGVVRLTATTTNEPGEVSVDLPPRTSPGATVSFNLSNTFEPESGDRRQLGVVVNEVRLTPASGHFIVAPRLAALAGVAVAAAVLGVWVCELPLSLAILVSVLLAGAFAGLLLDDGAFIGAYVDRLVGIGVATAVMGVVMSVVRGRMRTLTLPEWSAAAGLLLGATALELGVFAHARAIVGDGVFQVHRGALVHAGRYIFTSVTPRPFFEFPYPIALYVAALPFWRFFPSDLDLVFLLRGVTLAAEAVAGFALYAAARRQWNDGRAALLVAACWIVVPAPLQALSNANLTNVFGQALFAASVAVFVWSAAPTEGAAAPAISRPGLALAAALLTAAFLSHFGTMLVGPPVVGLVAASLIVGGRGATRRLGTRLLFVLAAAVVAAYALYYVHFNAVYAKTLRQMWSQEHQAAAETSKVVAPVGVKLQRWAAGTSDDYGLPGWALLGSAALGMALLVRRRPREPFTLVLAAFLVAWAGLTALELAAPLEVRANLAVAPAIVCLAAYALWWLATRSRATLALALGLGAAIGWNGVRIALVCLGAAHP